MPDTNESSYSTVNIIKEGLRYLGDASYAILPEDVAHCLAELKKSFWGGVRWFVEKEMEWIDARVAGGDRLREEWQRRHSQNETKEAGGNI
ncbi:MAG: hypothetical protein M3362_04285 [Acidobacteriota bacterium]|nr:hypothetical protein [Acidobacteriota bacterium]